MTELAETVIRFMHDFEIEDSDIAQAARVPAELVERWKSGAEEPEDDAIKALDVHLKEYADAYITKDETLRGKVLLPRVQKYYQFLSYLSYYQPDKNTYERFACEGLTEAAPQPDKLRIVVLHDDILRMQELQATVKYYPDLSIVAYEQNINFAIAAIDMLKPQVVIMSAMVGYELPVQLVEHVEKMPVQNRPFLVVLAESSPRLMKRLYDNLPLSEKGIRAHWFTRDSGEDDMERLFGGFYRIEGNTVKLPQLGQYRVLRVTEIDGYHKREIDIESFIWRYLGYRIRKFRMEAQRSIPEICQGSDELDEETFYLAENGRISFFDYGYEYLYAALGHEDTDELVGAGHSEELARKIAVNPQPYLQEYLENAPQYFPHFKKIVIDIKSAGPLPVKIKVRRLHSTME